jgi:hypothetical protein
MTISEFLARIGSKTPRNLVLGVLYFEVHFNGKRDAIFTTGDVLTALLKARVPKARNLNITDVLSKSGQYVDSPGFEGNRRLWTLTPSGEKYVRGLVGEVAVEAAESTSILRERISKLKDSDVREYLIEAVECLQINALRAAIVFVWAGTVYSIRKLVMANTLVEVNAAVAAFQQKPPVISRMEDLGRIQEANLLLVAERLGIFDKNEKDILEKHCLDVRNKCGHPGNYRPGPKKVASVVEDVISIVFSKL